MIITPSTAKRIVRLYEKAIGYNPVNEGWTVLEALENLREFRAEAKAAQ